jgi:acyl-CoA hydrolase
MNDQPKIIAIKSVTDKGESKIVRMCPPGISLTANVYDGVVIVTEYGIADPKFCDEFLILRMSP